MGLGVGGCIIKCGGKGAYHAAQKGDERWIPAIRDVDVKDTSGCGDAFCAGFSVGLSHGFTPIDACRFAAATAAQVASGVGSGAGVTNWELPNGAWLYVGCNGSWPTRVCVFELWVGFDGVRSDCWQPGVVCASVCARMI